EPEFELADTGVFENHRYFDVLIEYAKGSPEDILIRITVTNRGPDTAALHLLPTLWFRNTWAWGRTGEGYWPKPIITRVAAGTLAARHTSLGSYRFQVEPLADGPTEFLFTENETNFQRLYNVPNAGPFVKDGIDDFLISGRGEAINSQENGTKAAASCRVQLNAGEQVIVRCRLVAESEVSTRPFGPAFDRLIEARAREADEFYAARIPAALSQEERHIARLAYAGLLWSKQFYHYVVKDWLEGDPAQPTPPSERRAGRNHDWGHLYNRDVLSMPDKWEYPWYAAWDLAFHMIPFATIDPYFAKEQLVLLLREWYLHPNGQMPAYEFAFSDVNPPVHAWACWRVYKMTGPKDKRDRRFLASSFQKLLLNFTWWVNRKDLEGRHLFSGGFLGLDNIGVFDRSKPLPTGGHIEQADGTAWMAFFCATMLSMALELAKDDPVYEDMASKFFEHFVAIVDAMNTLGGTGLWDDTDGFYYDQLHVQGRTIPLKIRSLVGIIPLFAAEVLDEERIAQLPGFTKRMHWFLKNRSDLARHVAYYAECPVSDARTGAHPPRLLAIPSRDRLERVLRYLLDEEEFLSPYGIRSVSRIHRDHPYVFRVGGEVHSVQYVPGESTSGLFGGNSNWRGPVWFPVNYLLIEALERYHYFYGDTLRVECPRGSGRRLNLKQVANQLTLRLTRLFLRDSDGQRPCFGEDSRFARDPDWRELVLFHEYFHGETGKGLGASHQTGWTALVTRCFETLAQVREKG
ncbi:MGH1-like glycoside hydrolase domain-containing protein, partial [Nitrospira sp. BLG_2]|uniref:MGH1-like glycoside hydrolase domain-containing protein n=1 Tax=Nitrospira sp. BLG_2 TaxID=3397507 RepID=UPI003B9AD857